MSRRGDGGNYPRIIGEGCARGCQAVRGASGWCSRTFARVLAYQGQVPVRPALAYSRAEIHPVPTGNVGPKKTRLSAGSSCWVDHQLSVIVNMIAATITKNPM